MPTRLGRQTCVRACPPEQRGVARHAWLQSIIRALRNAVVDGWYVIDFENQIRRCFVRVCCLRGGVETCVYDSAVRTGDGMSDYNIRGLWTSRQPLEHDNNIVLT